MAVGSVCKKQDRDSTSLKKTHATSDLVQENARTYGDRAPGLLSVTKLRNQASRVSGSCADSRFKSYLAIASVNSQVDSPSSSPEPSITSKSLR